MSMFGWSYPPGVTDAMIDDLFGEECEHVCLWCQECHDAKCTQFQYPCSPQWLEVAQATTTEYEELLEATINAYGPIAVEPPPLVQQFYAFQARLQQDQQRASADDQTADPQFLED